MFGKIMSISDGLMLKFYEVLTDEDLDKVKNMHPKVAKLQLGEIIVSQYHCTEAAKKARVEFEKVFSQKEIPQDLPEYKLKNKENIIAILINSGLVKSGNEARRLIKEGAVFFEDSKINSIDFIPKQSGTLKVGTRRFLKLII